MKCVNCGTENLKEANYCQECGSTLDFKVKGRFTNNILLNTIIWLFIASILSEAYAVIAMSLCSVIISRLGFLLGLW